MKTLLASVVLFAGVMTAAAIADTSNTQIAYADADTVPTLRCRTPNTTELGYCAIYLPPGESLSSDAFMSDSKRWDLDNTIYGQPGKAPVSVVLIKPKTNIPNITMIVYLPTTSAKGMYRAIVVSDPDAPLVSELHFQHVPHTAKTPGPHMVVGSSVADTFAAAQRVGNHARDVSVAMSAASDARKAAADAQARRRALADEIMNSPCKAHVDTAYKPPIGHTNFTPMSVYSDGTHTCIVMPTSYDGLALPYDGDELLHWQWIEADHLIRIDSRPGRIVLRDGSETVTILHE
jgi:hypothetical protein